MVIDFIKKLSVNFLVFYQQRKPLLKLTAVLMIILFGYFKPQQFADLWLTRNQQGQLFFSLGYYQQAANRFSDIRWQAYSLYAAEQFDQAATLYGQLEQTADTLARANALAHARRYVKARAGYRSVLSREPNNKAAQHNLNIVAKIIDDVNRLSDSQKAEEGDSPKELGDQPQTGDGAEKQQGRKQIIEQLDAQQLLLDPSLNEMWLRQVQKNPALFLANKFQMQLEQQNAAAKKTGMVNE